MSVSTTRHEKSRTDRRDAPGASQGQSADLKSPRSNQVPVHSAGHRDDNISSRMMRRVFDLAQKGAGETSPNPLVGAVVVRDGRIVGEGFHQCYGGPHAEVMALQEAGEEACGADLYVNLEPCAHFGQTPPCADRVIAAGITRVILSNQDPNPVVNGAGIRRLQAHGIQVVTDVLPRTGQLINEAYFKFMRTGQPFITLKWAQSIDGRIASATGDSQWISGRAARVKVHELRHATDAILVGIGTVLQDDPRLTVRHVRGNQPLRLILDRHLKTPMEAAVVCDTFRSKTVIFTCVEHSNKMAKLRDLGVGIEVVNASETGYVDLGAVLDWMAANKLTSLLVEGGQATITAFLQAGLADKLMVYIAAKIIGQGLQSVGDLGVLAVQDALKLRDMSFEAVGDDLLLQAYPVYPTAQNQEEQSNDRRPDMGPE